MIAGDPGENHGPTTNVPLTYLAAEPWFSLYGPVSLLFGPD
jgi:hypothetical protein